jgi:hypothetical protein
MPPRGLADNVILVVADVLGTKLNHVFSDRLYLDPITTACLHGSTN